MIKRIHCLLYLCAFSSIFFCQAQASALQDKAGIRLNPILVVLGGIDAEIPIKISPHLAITPTLMYQVPHPFGMPERGHGAGLRLDWHFNEVFNEGGYLSLLSSYTDLERSLEDNNKIYKAASKGLLTGVVLGYMWRKYKHAVFNVGLGVGYSTMGEAHYVADDGAVLESPSPYSLPSHLAIGVDWSLGWVF